MPVLRAGSIVMIGVVTLTASVAGLATPERNSQAPQGAGVAPQPPAAQAGGGRQGGGPPTRDPLTPGYVKATEVPDGQVPPVNANGNFIIGPTHPPSPDMEEKAGLAKGTIHTFTMESADSKIYPGIVRQPGGAPGGSSESCQAECAEWTRAVHTPCGGLHPSRPHDRQPDPAHRRRRRP